MQLLVTVSGKTITLQSLPTPVTPPPDAQYLYQGTSLAGACDVVTDQLYNKP